MDILVKQIRHLTDRAGNSHDAWDQATVWLFDDLPDEWSLTYEWPLSDGHQTVQCRKGGYDFVCKRDTRTEAEVLRDLVFAAVSGDATIQVESTWRPALPRLLSSGPFPSRLNARVELTFARLSELPDFKQTHWACSATAGLDDEFPLPDTSPELLAAGNAMGPQNGLWLPFSFDGGKGAMLLTERLAERAFRADVYARGELSEGAVIYRRIQWPKLFNGGTGHSELDLGIVRAVREG